MIQLLILFVLLLGSLCWLLYLEWRKELHRARVWQGMYELSADERRQLGQRIHYSDVARFKAERELTKLRDQMIEDQQKAVAQAQAQTKHTNYRTVTKLDSDT